MQCFSHKGQCECVWLAAAWCRSTIQLESTMRLLLLFLVWCERAVDRTQVSTRLVLVLFFCLLLYWYIALLLLQVVRVLFFLFIFGIRVLSLAASNAECCLIFVWKCERSVAGCVRVQCNSYVCHYHTQQSVGCATSVCRQPSHTQKIIRIQR